LAAIETSLAAQGRRQTVIEPRVHLAPGQSNCHFNVLRRAINAPVDRAGIKVVGDFVDNYKLGFPSELGVVLLLDPRTGAAGPRPRHDRKGRAARHWPETALCVMSCLCWERATPVALMS
jgi:alanine dehydrogenase